MEVLRYAAFASTPDGGNPAGVVLDATGMSDADMQRVAAEVGYSETAFLLPAGAAGDPVPVRYFSPLAEVPFCGHATIATAVAHAERHGPGALALSTVAGRVDVRTEQGADGVLRATLTSVAPRTVDLPAGRFTMLLDALGWTSADLDPSLPPRVAYAGAWHPVLAARTRARLADLDYDLDALSGLMAGQDWTTVLLVHRTGPHEFAARNPFPPGGVVEDPATGAAAAAFGGYLRELGLIDPPTDVLVRQGEDMGRPGELRVHVPRAEGSGIEVTGTAVPL